MRFFEWGGDFVGDIGEVDIHQRFADDAEREAGHFAVQVDLTTIVPLVQQFAWRKSTMMPA